MSKKKKPEKSLIAEAIYAALTIILACLFGFFVTFILIKTGAVTVNMNYGTAFFAFIFVCVAAILLCLWYLRYRKRKEDAVKIREATEKISRGDYEISLGKLVSDYKKIGEAIETVALRLRQAEEEKDDFINDFSHELKTPIVSIRGFAKLIANRNLSNEEAKEYLSFIVSESDRLVDLTASTLMLDRLQSNRLEVVEREFGLSELLRKSILTLQPEWEKKNIEIDADFGECTVKSNDELLSRVFINVLDNAIKYSRENGKVGVYVTESDGKISVTIADDGIGMDEETKRRMFDKYFRADKSRNTRGNGLGLATVKKIAELLELKITVNSKVDEGTRFTIEIPSTKHL